MRRPCEHTAPELLYLETRWASLLSFGLTAGLLKDVLPVDTRTNAATIRNHLHKVALRQELGDGQPRLAEVEGDLADGKEVPVPEGPIIVGIDGAYLRNWHDKGKKFEVIVGKSVPEVRDHRYFGLVQPMMTSQNAGCSRCCVPRICGSTRASPS